MSSMSQRTVNESPERSTAGLTSSVQTVDFTSAEAISIENTSSLMSVVGIVAPQDWLAGQPGEAASRKADFRTALRESLRANESMVKKLAKY